VLGNHDRSRVATRIGPAQARVAAMLLLTLRGTPTIYMGEELGMLDTPIPADRIRDPAELREPGQGRGRDPERTPYPWDGSPNRGFTTGTPWLPVGADAPHSEQASDPASMLSLYRRLIALRREHDALAVGALGPVTADGTVLRYSRHLGGERFHVALNTGSQTVEIVTAGGSVLADTHAADVATIEPGPLRLKPDQGILIRPMTSIEERQ
jgi:alpha-glucosidase